MTALIRKISSIVIFALTALEMAGQVGDSTALFRGSLDAALVSAHNMIHSNTSKIFITPLQIKITPSIFGEDDPMKIVLTMPGVQNNGEGDVGISIRGGDTDQSLISLDNVPIYNPSHLKGFVSSFNSDIVSGIDIYTGAFPAKYGSRLSGIVDITSADGDMKEYHGGITVGLLSSKIHIGGPIVKGHTSFIFSARKSYFPLILGRIYDRILDGGMYANRFSEIGYYDINAGITQKIGDKSIISLKFYNGDDIINIVPAEDKINSVIEKDTLKITRSGSKNEEKWGNTAALLRWQYQNNNLASSTYSYYSRYGHHTLDGTNTMEEYRLAESDSFINSFSEESSVLRKSGIEEYAIGSDIILSSVANHSITFGGKFSYQHLSPIISSTRTRSFSYAWKDDESEITENVFGAEYHLFTASIYSEDDISIGEKWNIAAGLRLTGYGMHNKFQLVPEPRIRGAFFITPLLTAKASYSRMSQAIHQLSSSNIASPSDLWVPSTASLPVMVSNNLTLGLWFENEYDKVSISSSIEGYYKTMKNTLDYLDGISLINQSNWEESVAVGRGRSYGIELMGKVKYKTLDASISYTLSESVQQYDKINKGEWFFANNDCRHNLFVGISYSPFRNFVISSSFYYKTGRRITISDLVIKTPYQLHQEMKPYYTSPNGIDVIWVLYNTYNYMEKNGYKMEDYHRLDLSFDYSIPHRKFGKSNINISFYNLYNHLNPYKITIAEGGSNGFTVKKLCIFPFMPSISYTFEF